MTANGLSQKIWDRELWWRRMIYFLGVNKLFFQFQHSTSTSKPSFQRKQKKFKWQWPNKQRRNQSHSNQRHPTKCMLQLLKPWTLKSKLPQREVTKEIKGDNNDEFWSNGGGAFNKFMVGRFSCFSSHSKGKRTFLGDETERCKAA